MTETNCVFCNIYNEKEPTTILYKDNDLVVFPDIRPATKHHYLIVPKEHLLNAKELKKEHIPVVENLINHGKRILEEKGTDLKEARHNMFCRGWQSFNHSNPKARDFFTTIPIRKLYNGQDGDDAAAAAAAAAAQDVE